MKVGSGSARDKALFTTSLWHADLPSFITLLGHYNFFDRGGGGPQTYEGQNMVSVCAIVHEYGMNWWCIKHTRDGHSVRRQEESWY